MHLLPSVAHVLLRLLPAFGKGGGSGGGSKTINKQNVERRKQKMSNLHTVQ